MPIKNEEGICRQINFIGRLFIEGATIFSIIEKSKETTFEFSENSAMVV